MGTPSSFLHHDFRLRRKRFVWLGSRKAKHFCSARLHCIILASLVLLARLENESEHSFRFARLRCAISRILSRAAIYLALQLLSGSSGSLPTLRVERRFRRLNADGRRKRFGLNFFLRNSASLPRHSAFDAKHRKHDLARK